MAQPTLTVEVAFVANPLGTLTWTDVTAYTAGVAPQVQSQRGRNYELGQNQTGTLNVTFKNTDGRFDPTNTSSPYYPYVLPMRPIRVRATYSGTTYNLFRGFVERWPQKWDASGTYGTAPIVAVDGFSLILDRVYGPQYASVLGSPRWWIRFNGGGGAAGTNAGTFSNGLTISGGANIVPTTVASAVPGSSDSAVKYVYTMGVNSAERAVLATTGSTLATSAPYSIDMWLKVDTATVATGTGKNIVLVGHNTGNPGTVAAGELLMQVTSTSPTTFTLGVGTGAGTVALSSTTLTCDGVWHYIALTVDSSNTAQIFLDGVLAWTSSTGAIAAPGGTGWANIFVGAIAGSGVSNQPFSNLTLHYDEVTMVDTVINPGTRYASGGTYSEYQSETTSQRVGHILDSVNWPSGDRSLETGLSTVNATGSVAGSTPLALMQAAAAAELGNVFINGSGQVVFHNRSHRNSASVAATFGDGTSEFPYQGDIELDFDPTYLFNEVQITQDGTSPAYISTAFDTTSITSYGTRTLANTQPLSASADADGMAATLLAWYKDPRARVPQITLEGRANNSNFPQMLGREIGDLITVKRRPPGAPVISVNCFIDGIAHNITPTTWLTTFQLTPQFPNTTY